MRYTMRVKQIKLYDTTLRDGAQSEDVNLSATDKLRIAEKLDALGLDYIEGGWPGANPIENKFFDGMKHRQLRYAKLAAFGSTHHHAQTPENDPTLTAIVSCGASVGTIFGKSCAEHVRIALGISCERNLEIVANSIGFLTQHLDEVFFDAEHFFDGFKRNPEYALAVLKTAWESGAQCLALCDTNGGSMPSEIEDIIKQVHSSLPQTVLGIHAHNDCELAVSNTLAAIRAGATQVQGTINGIGERAGNANLCSIIPNIILKSHGAFTCLPEGKLALLKESSAYVTEVANMAPFHRQAFVGQSAFAHKGGVHVSAINKQSSLYEHITPELVGNTQRVLMTEQGGKSNIVALAKRLGITLAKDDSILNSLATTIKENSADGYDYAAAEASVELLMLKALPNAPNLDFFETLRMVILNSKRIDDDEMMVEATLKVNINGALAHTAAGGHGPVHALDRALRKALLPFYPELEEMSLTDYKVRVLSPAFPQEQAETDINKTSSQVRVLIESSDHTNSWVTVGVSKDVIEASWIALTEAVIYKLYKAGVQPYQHATNNRKNSPNPH